MCACARVCVRACVCVAQMNMAETTLFGNRPAASSMTGRKRCELRRTKLGQWGDASSVASCTNTNKRTALACQAALSPDSELERVRQADEGRVSPTTSGRLREGTPTASCYPLRKAQARTYRREKTTGPGARSATSHTRATATDTGIRRGDWCEGRTSGFSNGRLNSARTVPKLAERCPALTMQVTIPTRCPLCTVCYTHPNSMRSHLRRTHSDQRKVVARDVVSSNNADTRAI